MANKILCRDARGCVACSDHAPVQGAFHWTNEGWRAFTLNDRVDYAAEHGSVPICAACEADMNQALKMTIRRRVYDVASIADASRLYQRLRDESGLGASRWPHGQLSNGMYVSYNGRVWRDDVLIADAASEVVS